MDYAIKAEEYYATRAAFYIVLKVTRVMLKVTRVTILIRIYVNFVTLRTRLIIEYA
jgi:hypothetical protein